MRNLNRRHVATSFAVLMIIGNISSALKARQGQVDSHRVLVELYSSQN